MKRSPVDPTESIMMGPACLPKLCAAQVWHCSFCHNKFITICSEQIHPWLLFYWAYSALWAQLIHLDTAVLVGMIFLSWCLTKPHHSISSHHLRKIISMSSEVHNNIKRMLSLVFERSQFVNPLFWYPGSGNPFFLCVSFFQSKIGLGPPDPDTHFQMIKSGLPMGLHLPM